MHFNTGYHDEALPLVRRFADVFAEAELVVVAVGFVRRDGPRPLSQVAPRPATHQLSEPGATCSRGASSS